MTQETLEKKAEVSSGVHLLQQIALLLLSLLLAVGIITWGIRALRAADPYMQSVLSTAGNVARGEEIFKLNCATCHGFEASGEVGPNLHGVSDRKSRVGLIDQVISGDTPPMPQFQPTAKDMADLLEFLETL